MASEAYWRKREAELDDPTFGAFRRYPMPDSALLGNGPYFATGDALQYLSLNRPEAALRLLEGFLPRLLAALPRLTSSSADDFKKTQQLASLYEEAHIAVWLRDGTFDTELAASAFHHLHHLNATFWGDITTANLLHLMLLAAEGGAALRACELYLEHDPNPLTLPPHDLRFSRNPRAVLFAHLRLSDTPNHHDLLDTALNKFISAAAQWDKGAQPIPYVGLTEATRVVFLADSLRQRQPTVPAVARRLA